MLEDELGDVIQKARQGRGLAVEQLASRAGMEPYAVAKLEGYAYDPTDGELAALANALGLSQRRLLGLANFTPEKPQQNFPWGRVKILTSRWGSNCYIVFADDACAVIDPAVPPNDILQAVGRNVKRTAVLLTHGHADHSSEAQAVAYTARVPVYIGRDEPFPCCSCTALRQLKAGDELSVGSTKIKVISTPGHTSGSVSYHLDGTLFVGDALFAGSLGRAAAYEGAYEQVLASGRRILDFPGETVIFPGHGPATSVDEERTHNPFFPEFG